MQRFAQTRTAAALAVRYDCFYQRRVPTTVVQWVAELANGTNGVAQRQAARQPKLACLLVPYRALARSTWSQSHQTRQEEYAGVLQRVIVALNLCIVTGICLLASCL